MTYDEFQASEEKPDKKAKAKAGSKRKRSPSPVEKKVSPAREQKNYVPEAHIVHCKWRC